MLLPGMLRTTDLAGINHPTDLPECVLRNPGASVFFSFARKGVK